MRTSLVFFILISCLTQISCSSFIERIPGVYSLDVYQGNMIDQDMIDQLRPNMNKRQVLYIMGSPMLQDVFHQNRWDYLYSEQPGGEARQQKRISLLFDDDVLIGVQGDYRPTSMPVMPVSKDTTVDVPQRELDKSLYGRISRMFDSDDKPAANLTKETKESDTEVKKTDDKEEESEGGFFKGITDLFGSDDPEPEKSSESTADENTEENSGKTESLPEPNPAPQPETIEKTVENVDQVKEAISTDDSGAVETDTGIVDVETIKETEIIMEKIEQE